MFNPLLYASIEYLRSSRENLWNADYFAFLVQQVWKMNKPVSIIDFGCGMGYLGVVLLPLLPEGSSYTGIDRSSELLEQARSVFAETKWKTKFIEQDLTIYEPTDDYDVAICQAVLIHIPSPNKILEKMAQSIKSGGRIICIEPNWGFTQNGLANKYRHGMEILSFEDWGLIQKSLDLEIKRGGCDRYIGIKIPAMMHDLGLINIDIRVNDKASFYFREPDKSALSKDRTERREKNKKSDFLSEEEAERLFDGALLNEDYENGYDGQLPIVQTGAWLISYAEKP